MATPEEKAQDEKNAILSMKAAQTNMKKALDRIQSLEWALENAANSLKEATKFVHGYPYRSEESYAEKLEKAVAAARKVL